MIHTRVWRAPPQHIDLTLAANNANSPFNNMNPTMKKMPKDTSDTQNNN